MNLVIDYGNTRAKVAIFEGAELVEKFLFNDKQTLKEFLTEKVIDNLIISSVSHPPEEIAAWANAKGMEIILKSDTPLPIQINYATPATLGVDRIAAVCGAWTLHTKMPSLTIDAGTCITYEFLDALGIYHGGAISPGAQMRLQALHTFTSKLPLVPLEKEPPLIGNSTFSSIQSGVVNGMIAEINGMIDLYTQKHPDLGVILCGGDHYLFENQLKPSIFVAPDLVLLGLNRILLHNATLL